MLLPKKNIKKKNRLKNNSIEFFRVITSKLAKQINIQISFVTFNLFQKEKEKEKKKTFFVNTKFTTMSSTKYMQAYEFADQKHRHPQNAPTLKQTNTLYRAGNDSGRHENSE